MSTLKITFSVDHLELEKIDEGMLIKRMSKVIIDNSERKQLGAFVRKSVIRFLKRAYIERRGEFVSVSLVCASGPGSDLIVPEVHALTDEYLAVFVLEGLVESNGFDHRLTEFGVKKLIMEEIEDE